MRLKWNILFLLSIWRVKSFEINNTDSASVDIPSVSSSANSITTTKAADIPSVSLSAITITTTKASDTPSVSSSTVAVSDSNTSPAINAAAQGSATGAFVVKPGIIFPVSEAYLVSYGDAECNCLNLCMKDPRCRQCCWITHPEIDWCRFSNYSYATITQLPRANGTGAFTTT